MTGDSTITLQRREGQTKNGDYVYRRSGVRASVYVNQRIFKRGTVPQTITIASTEGDVFRLPHNRNPEATAKQVAWLEDRVARKEAISQDALSDAEILRTKVGELNATLDEFEG
jgi:hypothetical protein